MRKMELFTLGAMTEQNNKQLKSLLDGYRRMLFPGVKEDEVQKDAQLEEAKRQLANEVDKVFLVRPLDPNEGLPSGSIKSPSMARLHAKQLSEEREEEVREARRWANVPVKQRRPPPKG